MDDARPSWDEIVQLARDFDRTEASAAKRAPKPAVAAAPARYADGPVHIGAVPRTKMLDERRYKLGLANIDRRHGPLLPGKFTVVGARIGVGKTAFAEQFCLANAREYHVMFATLEQPNEDIRDSILARLMNTTLDQAENEMRLDTPAYRKAVREFDDLNLTLWRPARRRTSSVDDIMNRAVDIKADIAVIDFARYVTGWGPGGAADAVVQDLSQAAKDTLIHTMLLSQLKADAHGRRPKIVDIQDTTRVEQEADSVLLLYRPFDEAGNDRRDNIAEIIGAKVRRAKKFRGHTHWYGAMRSFYAMDEVDEARALCCARMKPRSTPTLAPDPEPEPDEDLGDPQDLFPSF